MESGMSTEEVEQNRSMGCGSPDVGPPLPKVLLPDAATAPSELRGIPPPVAAEAEGCQSQLEPPRFLPFPFRFPLGRPAGFGKDWSFPAAEEDWLAEVLSDVFWDLPDRPAPEDPWSFEGEALLFPDEE